MKRTNSQIRNDRLDARSSFLKAAKKYQRLSLRTLYLDMGMTIYEIAAMFGLNPETIRGRLKSFGIRRRKSSSC